MESALPARVDLHPGTGHGRSSRRGVVPDLHALLGPRVWRAHEQAQIRTQPTGFDVLDRALPGGGWPLGAVSEVLHAQLGVGELSLALPLVARLTQAGRPVALVAPPMLPYAPRLAASGVQLSKLLVVDRVERDTGQNALWCAEQLLRAAAGAVLLWIEKADAHALRRLQLAAEESDSCVLLYRSERYAAESTPSALRLRIWRQNAASQVEVLKCRGARPSPLSLRTAA